MPNYFHHMRKHAIQLKNVTSNAKMWYPTQTRKTCYKPKKCVTERETCYLTRKSKIQREKVSSIVLMCYTTYKRVSMPTKWSTDFRTFALLTRLIGEVLVQHARTCFKSSSVVSMVFMSPPCPSSALPRTLTLRVRYVCYTTIEGEGALLKCYRLMSCIFILENKF